MTRAVSTAAAVVIAAAALTAHAETTKLADIVESYRAAKAGGDEKAAASYLSDDSRIWFEKKEGPGKKRGEGGRGPWADWDDYFNGVSHAVSDYKTGERSVSVVMEETNDFLRIIERTPSRYRATYYFDENDRISGVLIASARTEPITDRLDELKEWLRANHPDALKQLMPDDRLVPSLENATLWRRLGNEWRRTVGLEPID